MSKFCPAPWMTLSTDVNGSLRPCCRYEQPQRQDQHEMPWMYEGTLDQLWNGPEFKKLRQAFIDDEQPQECKWCWDEEASGVESFRQKYIRRGYDVDTTNVEASPPLIYDFKLSNVCNLKCRMCGPQASSSILKEEKRAGREFWDEQYWLSNKILETDNEEIFFNEWLPNVRELEFTGGEPFFSPENKSMIQRIGSTPYAQNIRILITTNASIFDKKTLDSLAAFRQVNMSFSIDDIGDRLAYQRSGSKWEDVATVIKRIRDEYPSYSTAIYRTINNYNVWYLSELEEWAFQEGFDIVDGFLHEPKWLSIRHLPNYAKRDVKLLYQDSNSKSELMSFLDLPSEMEDIETFRVNTLRYDLLRGELFHQIFDEWSEVLMIDG